mgnify:CR=1 FL=1|tara:strand:- start:857 stop:1165 length:309 start_codon:yes stop_codon:yes gene_type:complete
MALRWRRDKRETGLRAVGAAPSNSGLWDGDVNLANTSSKVFCWRNSDRKGYYWSCPTNEDYGITWKNTCRGVPLDTEKEAKEEATKYIKECIKKFNKIKGGK